ncbi:MAG: PKD domain-containing protein [bacterium]|nr:PKD domain-containing protein [bacterium]
MQSSRAQRQGNGCDRTFQCESSYWDGNTRYYDPYCTGNGGTCQFKTQSCPFGQNASGTGCAEAPLGVCSSGYVDKRQQPDCFGSRVFNDPNQNPYCYQCQPASIQASFGPPWNNDSYTQGQSVPFSLGLNVAACSNAVSSGTVTFTLAGQSSTVTKSMTLGSQTLFSSSLYAPTTLGTHTAGCSYNITVTFSNPNDPNYSRQTTQSGSCAPRTITVVPPAIPGACDRGPGGAQEQTYAWNESLGSLCSSPGGSSGLSDPGASGGKISWTCLGKDRGSDASCSATRTARPCESVPNACGKTAAGVYRADGSCSASVPSNSLCGCDNNWSIRVDEKTGSCIDKSWGTDVSSIYIAGSENYYACTQGYKQVWQCKTCESASNACGVKATGTYQEDGSCSAVPPTISYAVGASCPSAVNNCGATNTGTIQCDGSCLATAPANVDLSGTCLSAQNNCGATSSGSWQCGADKKSRVCGAVAPANVGSIGTSCSSSQNSCADTISGTWQCSASKTNKTCSVTTAPERAGYGDDCSACNNVNECNPGKKIVCTAGGGVACNVGAPLDKFTLLYSAGSGGSIVGSMSQTITRGQSGTLVTASPATGYDFIKWSDNKTSSSRGETNVQGNVSVVATFSIKSYALSVSKTGTGSGTVTSNPSGINCGLTCSANFNHGTTVALTASPTSGSSLGSWLGCDTVVGNTCNVLINGIKSVSVSFQAPPSIQSASQGPAPNYCGASPSTTFSWRYNSPAGLNQSRFDFRIIDQSTGTTVVSRSFSGLNNPNNTQNSQAVIVSLNPLEADRVAYNKSYRWEAQVWDSAGESSSMAGGTFTTTARAYPKPSFSYSPQTPGIGETVTFTETSKCYNNLNVSGDCKNMSVSYLWNFTDGNTSSTKGNTIHSFVSGGSYPVSLRITDDSRVCEYAIPVRIQLPFPAWEEVSPF